MTFVIHRRRIPLNATLGALVLTSTAFIGAFGCNAILGIEEGKLVGTEAGAGGDHGTTDASSSGGAGNGSGGNSADSGSGGGKATGGRGGGPGAGGAGSGGKATGDAGTADAGTGDAGTGGTVGGVPDEVHCGTSSCKLAAGQVCCVATTTGEAHCSASCDSSTQQKFACDGAEDCKATNGKCCYATGSTTAACAVTCQGRVFCGSNADCAPGQYCAPGAGALATVAICADVPKANTVWCAGAPCDITRGKSCCYSKATKTESCIAATSCAGSDVSFTCDGPEDCPTTGSVCCATKTGLGLLTGTQCSTTGSCAMTSAGAVECGGTNGCAAGSSCCLSATGTTTCAGQCATAQTVCGTSADCGGAVCTLLTDATIGKATGRLLCR